MAYSSVRVQFEIGHEASVRTKKTPEGFTHDWEVFVRGADNTDIQCFVDKVVFHLHETFPKPKRVIKEPPYIVKESGYAGFVLPIDVYLKNKEEPKKISFQYDLNLQPSGPPISRVLREPRLFQNPSEDFRRKLIRGGGVGVDTPSSESQVEDLKSSSSSMTNQSKAKVTESPVKKHKPDVPTNHSFAELFGTPIRRVVEPKKLPEVPKKKETPESDKKKQNKHGVYKDEKEVLKEKEKYLEKEKNKERDKTKDKLNKKPSPPAPLSQVKSKDDYKKYDEKEKKREDHEDKKRKKEDKEKKEKDLEKQEHKKEKKDSKETEYLKKIIPTKPLEVKGGFEKPVGDSTGKEKTEKEKHKHRHKKKEKEKNRDREKHRKEKDSKERSKEKEVTSKKRQEEVRDKEEKGKRKSRSASPVQEKTKKGPLNALLDELGSSDSASPLSEEEAIPSFKSFSKTQTKLVPESKLQSANVIAKLKSTNLNSPVESKSRDSSLGKAKEKSVSKKNKKSEKDLEKKKVKEERRPRSPLSEKEDEEEVEEDIEREKTYKEERVEEEKPKVKDKENRKKKKEKSDEKQSKKKSGTESVPSEIPDEAEDTRRPDKFTKEYIAQLKELQHRIMSLEDNAELRKVVKVIEETGQYEITKKTFDFDLCALDFETVRRLQDFFAPT